MSSLRVVGIIMTLTSITVMCLMNIIVIPTLYRLYFTILFGFLLTLFLPGIFIDLVFSRFTKGITDEYGNRCGGLPSGGYLIGFTERSLIFLAIMITYYDSTLSYASVLSFLSVVVAGKAIFRYSSKETNDRACADWYILGTLMSITIALALTWVTFRFLLVG